MSDTQTCSRPTAYTATKYHVIHSNLLKYLPVIVSVLQYEAERYLANLFYTSRHIQIQVKLDGLDQLL